MPSAIAIKKVDGKPGQVYYPLEKITIPEPKPKDNEVSKYYTQPTNSYLPELLKLPTPYLHILDKHLHLTKKHRP